MNNGLVRNDELNLPRHGATNQKLVNKETGVMVSLLMTWIEKIF